MLNIKIDINWTAKDGVSRFSVSERGGGEVNYPDAHYPDHHCTNQFLLVFISYCWLGHTLQKFSQFNTSDKKK